MKTSSEEILEKLLSGLEKKRKKAWILNGTAEFLLVLFVSLGSASILAYIYSNGVYFSILKIVAILAICLSFVKFLVSSILKKEGKVKLALELEKISPGLGEDTLNAVLLTSDLTKPEKGLGVSKFLTEAHISEVARKLESMDLSPIVPREKIKSYWKPLAATFVLSATMLILAPRGFRSFLLSTNILPPSEPTPLELADIEIVYEYPAYTKLPSRVVKGSTGDVRAIKGTHVAFEATPLERLTKGELVIENALVIPVGSDGEKIKGEFTVLSNGGFFIQDKSGKLRSKTFKIVSEEDKNPKVTIQSPSEDVIEVQEKENLSIFYKAEDDFGLTKLILVWRTKNGESSKLVERIKEESKSLEGKFTWDFRGIESEPGEVIEVKIKAYDNDTVSGPKVGISNPIKVKLNDSRKKHENVLASVEKIQEELLDILADEIENRHHNNKVNTNSTKKIQESIASKIEKAISSVGKILEDMKDDDFSDYTYFLGLSNMKIRIEDILGERRDLLASFSVRDFSRLGSLITREINEFEDDVLFLDSILKGERLRESLLYGRDALNKYNELSELLRKFEQSGDEATRKEIEKKMEELRSLVSQLTERLGSISRDIPEGFLNQDSFKVVDLQGKMDEIMKLIDRGKIDEALKMLAGLGSNLQEMVATLQSGFQSFSLASLSKEITELNEILERIKGLEEAEKSLKEGTENLKNSLLKDPSKKGNLLQFVEREKRKLENLKNLLMETKAKVFQDTGERGFVEGSLLIDRILDEADELKHWLEAFEFREALRQAEMVEEQAIGLRNLSDLRVDGIAKADREIEESAKLAEEIRQDLEQLQKGGGKEEKIQQFAGRQDEIAKDTSGLADRVRGLSEDNLFPAGIGEKLGESKGFMENASRNLNGKEISKAISDQEEALKALRQAREEAEGLLGKYQLSARGMGISVPFVLGRKQFQEGVRGVDTSYVNIPSAEEFKGGKEFKESLLKALKDGSPEGYGELNKKYYERIIK